MSKTPPSGQLDDVFVALADETRRAILARLSAGEARVTEVAAPFDISLNSVSKHIRILERAGLVTRRRSGRDHYLSLDPRPLTEASDWLQSRQRFWAGRVQRLQALLDEEDASPRKPPSGVRRP
ncbi:MAG: metalloregulator ArsR/SmtB family transcription factor [Hydrogenophaga sp.]|uniref:ArsR/SmtB family transcription factor n=1 Tax=Hydrogenophaga sp. TaxID=1904254 RepID=UPI00168F2255|nr:metalloregulator ArsR/SmtB family transcription factor [Hydrogenophaga sp.]NIM43765.1 metalloregulator ArsR/SmtB family transcription factor [Hydrogenophaga sp.]NIN28831.1 metalloregulator ArsR/SmtB family transcription factor [Hydrogenophaga sp.]NIN33290.1 metalloregulator ArsR/SmtB family transcription factor [Hydrogenophaga sp.]NIN57965.1 metalloregulator ArsR/SmtB family transcription factor [Hydrogenophaga sp.]NIO54263.1 metalloregulator ArsR/SmtB family transcription factor [Hydrogeno